MSTAGNVRPTHRGGKPHKRCSRLPQLDVARARQADRDDCEHYDECRNKAAMSNAPTVCSFPCGDLTPRQGGAQ